MANRNMLKNFFIAPPNIYAAAFIWIIGTINTFSFMRQMGLSVLGASLWIIPSQMILTYLQHFLWTPQRRAKYHINGKPVLDDKGQQVIIRHRGFLPWAALSIDTMINLGGSWVALKYLRDTQAISAIFEAFNIASIETISGGIIFFFALILSYIIATAPEYLWRLNKDIL